MIIYHITSPAAWRACEGRPSYRTASLETEGFIHCSYPAQLEKVIDRYFRGKGRIAMRHYDNRTESPYGKPKDHLIY